MELVKKRQELGAMWEMNPNKVRGIFGHLERNGFKQPKLVE